MSEVALNHRNLSVLDKVARGKSIEAGLTGNAHFPDATATKDAIKAATDELEAKRLAADATKQAAHEAVTHQKTAETDWDTKYADAGAYVESKAKGDEAKILSSGFAVKSAGAPVGAMPAPENASASGGDMEGEIDFSWNPVRGRTVYAGEQALSPTGPWTQFYIGTRSSCTAPGLVSGTAYWLRVRAIGAAGPGPWSDPATWRAT
jgi:hypothetical protein